MMTESSLIGFAIALNEIRNFSDDGKDKYAEFICWTVRLDGDILE